MKVQRNYRNGENIPPAIVHRKFGYLVLHKARIDKHGQAYCWYGTPKT